MPEVIRIECPMCRSYWANASIRFGQPVSREQFSPLPELEGKVKFQKNGLPYCPVCNFKYEPRAMLALMIAAANKLEMERKLHGGVWDKP